MKINFSTRENNYFFSWKEFADKTLYNPHHG